MIYTGLLGVYLIVRYYYKNIQSVLFYLNTIVIIVMIFVLSIGGVSAAASLGVYSLTLFILMFIELSINFLKK